MSLHFPHGPRIRCLSIFLFQIQYVQKSIVINTLTDPLKIVFSPDTTLSKPHQLSSYLVDHLLNNGDDDRMITATSPEVCDRISTWEDFLNASLIYDPCRTVNFCVLIWFLHQPVMIPVRVTVLVRDPRVVLSVLKDITRLKMRAVKVIWLFSAVSLSFWI